MSKEILSEADRAIIVEALRLATRTYREKAQDIGDAMLANKFSAHRFEQKKQMQAQEQAALHLCRRIQSADAIDLREIA